MWGFPVVDVLRRVGVAFGSLVAAWLAVSLVGSLVLGPVAQGTAVWWLAVVVLGGLIYADIARRDRLASERRSDRKDGRAR